MRIQVENIVFLALYGCILGVVFALWFTEPLVR